jgi:hypothetical protein
MSRRQRGTSFILAVTMNRQELEEKIDELVREYFENEEPEIPEQIDELARQLREWAH